uniref:Glycosyl transferase, family 39 n=1 Tax=Solibacter usitatus (strain Ellin6076) TaxID=234267 RepID=Q02D94_SOLUE
MNRARLFWPAVGAILAIAGTLEVRSAMGETQTWDEGIHIVSGFSYLTLGDYSWNVEHPPLVKIMSALPLRFMGLTAHTLNAEGKRQDQVQYGVDFLYHNRLHADTILIAARAPNILLTLLFTLAVGWWTRRRYGTAAGLMAAAMCAFDPNLIAHGRYVTTDFPITAFFFFSCVLWVEYLEQGSYRRSLAACVAIGLALITKFSSVLLLPPLLILYVACWIRRPREFPIRRAATAAATVFAVAAAMVLVVYWPETLRCFRTSVPRLADVARRENAMGEALYRLGNWFNLPSHSYLFGLNAVADHNAGGHSSYLLGMRNDKGWWYYFPVVFAVKSTMAALAAALLLLAASVWQGIRRQWISPMAMGLSIPPLLYFIFSMTSGINIGMRHILPVYPFLYVGIAALLSRAAATHHAARYAMILLVALQIGECARIAPDYLAFFNELAGGPGRGPEYLVDSNIDWGQDVKKLVHWLDQHGTRRARVYYFGNAQMRYYGVDEVGYPGALDQQGWYDVDEYCVASVTPLHGVYVPLADLAQLRLRQPIAKIGWSMYVYDLRKNRKLEQLRGLSSAKASAPR